MSKKKDVAPVKAARVGKTKKSNPPPKMLSGYVEARMIRCGKPSCKCARGELHGPYFYRFTIDGGRRSKTYVRLSDAAAVRAACAAYREQQREVREGRARYRMVLALAREVLGL